MVGYKGNTVFESPVVYEPYIPVMGGGNSGSICIPHDYTTYIITSNSPLIVTEYNNKWDDVENLFDDIEIKEYIIDENIPIADLELILDYLEKRNPEGLDSYDYIIKHLPDSLTFLIL